MKRTLTIAALMLAAFTAFAQTSTEYVKDWAHTDRYAADNAKIRKTPKAVFMGDSITDNWSNNSHPSFFTDHNFAGRGISGQTTAQMLVRFRSDVIDLQPKYVVILAGTNDIALNNGPISKENILKNIQSMCELAIAHKIKPVLCSVLPAYKYGWRPELTPAMDVIELNNMIETYAKEAKIQYVDFHSAMKDDRDGLPENYAPDGIHPNMEGYLVMEKMILKVLK